MRPRQRPGQVREILGAPFVPPAGLTRAVVRSRSALLGAHRRSAPPSIRVLEGLFGLFDNRVLGLLVELDVPDRLGQPRTAGELAAATGTEAVALDRVLRYAAARGLLGRDRRGRYRANGVSDVLRRDHPNSWRGWVEMAGSDWFWDAWRSADRGLRAGPAALEAATGHPFFDFVNVVRPEAGRAFNAAMEAGSTLQALVLSHGLDWSGVETVCDVGGGTGAALEHLLGAHPHLRATLFDLPEVVAAARPSLVEGPLAARCRIVDGSFFDEVPAGCDRYLLLAVVHDWDDDRAVQLLGRVREAFGPASRAVVVENVLSDPPRDDFAVASDLLMLILASGRERTVPQYESLFRRSGLSIERRVALASGFTAFALTRR